MRFPILLSYYPTRLILLLVLERRRGVTPPYHVGDSARGARSGRERRSESWLGAQTPPRPHGEADADAGRRGTKAPRRPRAADASQAASATSVFTPAPDRAHADRARENHRESAADSRKQATRPAQGARTAKRQGVTAISRLPNPRDARRNARICAEPQSAGNRTHLHRTRGGNQRLAPRSRSRIFTSRQTKIATSPFVYRPSAVFMHEKMGNLQSRRNRSLIKHSREVTGH